MKNAWRGLVWLGRNGDRLSQLMLAAENYKSKESAQEAQRRIDIDNINNVRREYQDLMVNLDIVAGYLKEIILEKLK